jgi:GDP-L-fucose synthase
MPTTLYGPNDYYDLETSHVLPALIRKVYEAKIAQEPAVEIWGTGSPKREFLHVDDMADACFFVMEQVDAPTLYDSLGLTHLNIGSGTEISIRELAELIQKFMSFHGELSFDASKPDGTPRKIMDVSTLDELGWTYSIGIEEGIQKTIQEFEANPVQS